MEENKKRGGKRQGAGRKKVIDPKIPVTIYVEKSAIEDYGSEEQFKAYLGDFISNKEKIPLPPNYVEVKNIGDLHSDGQITPILPLRQPKTKKETPTPKKEEEVKNEPKNGVMDEMQEMLRKAELKYTNK